MFDYYEIYNTKILFTKLLNKMSVKNCELQKIKINRFFEILKRLKMENGWKAFYEYNKQASGGHPSVYAINKSGEKDHLYNRVITDGTTEGFIQLALLILLHDKFCLSWHANYMKIDIIISIRDLASLPFDEEKLINIAKDIEIQTKKDTNFINLNICTFNSWEGLKKIPFSFNVYYPHKPTILIDEIKTIEKYDCGLCY